MMHLLQTNKNFRHITFANIFSLLGDKLYYLALLTYVSTLPNAQLAIGLVTASELLPQLLSSYTGYLADRTYNRRSLLLFADFSRSFLYLIVAFVFIYDINTWMILLIVVLINLLSDILGSYASGLRQPLLVEVVGKEDFTAATGLTQASSQIISILSQFVGASLLLIFTYTEVAYLNALSFFLSASIMILFFRKNHPLKVNKVCMQSAKLSYKSQFKESLILLKHEPRLMGSLLSIVGLNMMISSIIPLLQMLLVSNHFLLIGNYSFTLAIINTILALGIGLGGLVGTKLLAPLAFPQLLLITLGMTLILYPMFFLHSIYALLICLFAMCFTIGTLIPQLSGWIVQIIPNDRIALLIGMINSILVGFVPLTTVLIVALASFTSPFLAIGVLFTLSLLLFSYQLHLHRQSDKSS